MLPTNTVSVAPCHPTKLAEGNFGLWHFQVVLAGTALEFSAFASSIDYSATSDKVWLSAHVNVQDGSTAWYAFFCEPARALFLQLVAGVEGWGPKTAATFIGQNGYRTVAHAIEVGTSEALAELRGVGPKALPKLVECVLKDKPKKAAVPAGPPLDQDAVKALMAMGHKKPAAEQAVRNVQSNPLTANATTEAIIKAALRLPRPQ